MSWPANVVEATRVLFVSLRGKLALYIVSLLCPFCVLEHIVSILGKERVVTLTEHSMITAGNAWQNYGGLGLCPGLQML